MIDMSDLKFSIRRAEPNDAAGCCELMRNEDVFAGLLQLPYPTETAWRERLSSKSNEGDILLVAVDNGEVIGQISLFGNTQMRRRHAAMFGLAVIGHAQNKGVGSALMKAMIDYADRWTTFLRIELTVYADNANAIALYKKFGFEHEGLLRKYSLRNGRFEDVISMARFNPNQAIVR
jgi:putative acetyltransferase